MTWIQYKFYLVNLNIDFSRNNDVDSTNIVHQKTLNFYVFELHKIHVYTTWYACWEHSSYQLSMGNTTA